MTTKRLYLKGLGCADCANRIESDLRGLNGVKKADINFSTSTLSVEIQSERDWKTLQNGITGIIHKYEPNVRVTENRDHHAHSHQHDEPLLSKNNVAVVVGFILFILALAIRIAPAYRILLYIVSYLLIGGPILLAAARNIYRGQIFDENFLMSLATIGAFAIGEYPEAVAVMLFYQVGEFFQNRALDRSRKSIRELMDIRPDYANRWLDDHVEQVHPERVSIGDLISIKPGERVPLDGVVLEGHSLLDTSALTGESLPKEAVVGDEVLSGMINTHGLLTIRVSRSFGDSTVSKILELVEEASSNKAPTEKFITKFSRYYTPIVIFSALGLAILPPVLYEGAELSQWVYRALIFLVISCPCALVISIPLGFFGGIGAASNKGILVKGGNYLEALNSIDTIVFDKTGTLTKGVFEVVQIQPQHGYTKEEILRTAAYGEYYSNHPIALSILKKHEGKINKEDISDFHELSGLGIKVTIEEKAILLGNKKLIEKENIEVPPVKEIGTIIHVVIEQEYAGYLVIADELKEDAVKTIGELKKYGIRRTLMLTGDRQEVGESIASQLGMDQVYTELLPQDKVEIVDRIHRENFEDKKVAFVGDGINDAPVLARADLGIAMGGLGSDAAIEAADIVLMTDQPSRIIDAMVIARKTRRIVIQNIIFALTVKAFVLSLGTIGIATMWSAVFADVGVSLIAVFNSLRVLKVR